MVILYLYSFFSSLLAFLFFSTSSSSFASRSSTSSNTLSCTSFSGTILPGQLVLHSHSHQVPVTWNHQVLSKLPAFYFSFIFAAHFHLIGQENQLAYFCRRLLPGTTYQQYLTTLITITEREHKVSKKTVKARNNAVTHWVTLALDGSTYRFWVHCLQALLLSTLLYV